MMLLSQPLSLTHQRQLSTRHYTSAPKERFHFIPHCFLYCSEPTKPKTPKVLKFADQTSPLLTSSNVPQQAPPSLFLALDEEADDGGSGQTVRNLTEDLLVMEKVCSAAVVSRLTLHLILLLYYYIYICLYLGSVVGAHLFAGVCVPHLQLLAAACFSRHFGRP